MLKVGDIVKWMCPMDYDYYYGEIVSIRKSYATIKGIGLYKHIAPAEIHFKYIKRVAGGKSSGSSERDNKSFPTKRKL